MNIKEYEEEVNEEIERLYNEVLEIQEFNEMNLSDTMQNAEEILRRKILKKEGELKAIQECKKMVVEEFIDFLKYYKLINLNDKISETSFNNKIKELLSQIKEGEKEK